MPYVLPLAVLGSLLGSPGAALSAIFLLAVPVALWGAWRFLRVVGRLVAPAGAPRGVLLWGSVTYSLVPAVSGAWGDGRIGTVVVAVLLPWLAHAALGFADPESDRRWRAAWRSGLLLSLGAAFAPVLWVFAALLGLVVVAAAFAIVPAVMKDRSVWGPPAVALGTVPVLLSPWWLPALVHGAGEGLILEAGRLPMPSVDTFDLLVGRIGDAGAPWWWGVVLAVLALLALFPRVTRIPVLVCWIVACVAAVAAAILGAFSLTLAAGTTDAGLGALVVVIQGTFVAAAMIGAQGMALRVARASWSWRRVLALVLAAVGAAVPLGGLAWFVVGGQDRLSEQRDQGIPAYMVQSSMKGPAHGILVIRGDVDHGLTYTVRRGDGVTLGEDEVVDLTKEDAGFTRDVRALASRPTPAVVDVLAESGIEYVVLPAPADGNVAAALDATGGLVQASAEDRSTRAWQVNKTLDPHAVDGPRSWLRIALLVVQALGILVVAVLCVPTTDRRRQR